MRVIQPTGMLESPVGVAMVMSIRMTALIFLLVIHGVFSKSDWKVNYKPSHICALKNSSVIMNCTYKYPTGYQIEKVFWTKTTDKKQEEKFPDLSRDPEYSQRLGDKQQICNIRLNHVTLEDSHMYYFRFITNIKGGRWIGLPGVSLTVTDLQVESPERVTEGDSVRLTCKSSCDLTDRPTFIWYRNSQILPERRRNNELLLQSVRREDAGRYSCAVDGHKLTSPEVHLNVTYPPVTPVISISPPGVIVEGDSVTLNCSSDSNPPAEINWFKGTKHLKSGQTYSISNISSDDSGEYKCRSTNQHGEKYSDPVTLNVMYKPRSVSVSISPPGVIVEGDSVTLNCSSDSNPPALNFSWFKVNESSAVGSGRIYSISKISSDDSGEYKCRSTNQHGEEYSDPVTLNVMLSERHNSDLYVAVVAAVGCGFLLFICIVILIRRRVWDDGKKQVQQPSSSEGHHCEVSPNRPRTETPDFTDAEKIKYASIQHFRNNKTKNADLMMHHLDPAARCGPVEDKSVIYSTVK